MTSAATAQLLLFLALTAGPQHSSSTILATSESDNLVWTSAGTQWNLSTKGLPADEWTEQGRRSVPSDGDRADLRSIARHHWADHPILDLQDGSQVAREKDALFYIEHPGAPNQKVYTILFPKGD